jgi:hypothetical protein
MLRRLRAFAKVSSIMSPETIGSSNTLDFTKLFGSLETRIQIRRIENDPAKSLWSSKARHSCGFFEIITHKDWLIMSNFDWKRTYQHPRLSVIAFLTREISDPGADELMLRVLSGADVLLSGPCAANFLNKLECRSIIEVQSLVVPRPGPLAFVLYWKDGIIASWTVEMVQASQAPIQTYLMNRQSEPMLNLSPSNR